MSFLAGSGNLDTSKYIVQCWLLCYNGWGGGEKWYTNLQVEAPLALKGAVWFLFLEDRRQHCVGVVG